MHFFIIEAPSSQADDPRLQEEFTEFLMNEVIPSIDTRPTRTGQVNGVQLFTSTVTGGLNHYVLMVAGYQWEGAVSDALEKIRAAGGTVRSLPASDHGRRWVLGEDGRLELVGPIETQEEALAAGRPEAGEAGDEGVPAPA
ncbi:hypothetical protein JY651_33155 [Pyxidicoccus parkwayensis]|uniref:Uncharacterized protein n=1 Tax=Pyxidicoccus parkwayensis TaxID=2813578 RepID=A0ABX7NML3_9BACT|nr:hypothetical protein [Pyxidicoccus parkwaysis]QSQ20097.1 hypothetical protein JY651_33155 [Pyxidicoccus parkwaysis]